MPTVSVVIPALNEAANLPHVLPRIPGNIHEVILVDGDSTDGTVHVARILLPSIRIVQQDGPGKGSALRTGFAAATGDIIVMLDADGSAKPEEIPAFVEALVSGADFVKGSRFLPGGGTADMSRLRALGNWGFVALVQRLFGGRYTDLCYGYNAFWRRVLPVLDLDCTGFEIETLMNIRALARGLRVTEIPSFEAKRIHGASNLRTFRDGWRVLRTIVGESVAGSSWRFAATFDRPEPSADYATVPVEPRALDVRRVSIEPLVELPDRVGASENIPIAVGPGRLTPVRAERSGQADVLWNAVRDTPTQDVNWRGRGENDAAVRLLEEPPVGVVSDPEL